MSARAVLAVGLVAAAAARAAASPAVIPTVDERGSDGARVQMLGGALHHFDDRPFYVATAEITPELALSDDVSLLATLPLATVERDGEVAAGWGNVGAGVRLRSVAAAGDARWIRTLAFHVSAPTALDHGGAGFAARSAADVHAPLDLGDYMPGTISSRINASLRWQSPRWWVAGALVHRVHVFTFDRG